MNTDVSDTLGGILIGWLDLLNRLDLNYENMLIRYLGSEFDPPTRAESQGVPLVAVALNRGSHGRAQSHPQPGGAIRGEMSWDIICMCHLHCTKDCFCPDGLSAGETLNQPLEHRSKLSLSFATTVQGGITVGAPPHPNRRSALMRPPTEGVSDRAAAAAIGFGRQPSF